MPEPNIENRNFPIKEKDEHDFWENILRADAVIVLGHKIKDVAADESSTQKRITPSVDSKMRSLAGFEIFEKGKADNIIMSTGTVGQDTPISRAMKDYILREKSVQEVIDEEKILTEEISKNTSENLEESLKILKERGWHKVIIVTNEYHLERALLLFKNIIEKAGFEVEYQGVACENVLLERSKHYENLVSHYKWPSSLKSPKNILERSRELLNRVLIHFDKDDKIATFIVHITRK